MYHLYYHPLSAASRLIRLQLAEKSLDFSLKIEKTWERRTEFLELSPSGELPVLSLNDGGILNDWHAISEYLEETTPSPPLLGNDAIERAETRRLLGWYMHKFALEVTDLLVSERAIKRLARAGAPYSDRVQAARANIHYHLEYIEFLTERRNWLAGDYLSLADLGAAAQLSVVDYLGDVPWHLHQLAKDWYVRIKSRPSFRPLLEETIPAMPPAPHYNNLDF
jgi:glutathione S-transferase